MLPRGGVVAPIPCQAGSLEIETLIPSTDPQANTDPVVALRQMFRTTARPELSPSRALAALAIVDPFVALELLLVPSTELRDRVPMNDLARAAIAALAGIEDSASRSAFAMRVLEMYADALASDAATEIVANVEIANAKFTGVAAFEAVIKRLVKRFRAHPALLRVAIESARANGDAARADALLTDLGFADRSPATAALVRRGRDPARPAPNGDIRIAILSSYTIEGLVPHVDLAVRALGLRPEVYVAPFNSWTRDIVDDASGLRRFDPEIAFLAVAIDDLIPELVSHLSPFELATAGDDACERVVGVATAFAQRYPGIPLVVHGFHSAFAGPLGIMDGHAQIARTQWLASLNGTLSDQLRSLPTVYVLDVVAAATAAGVAFADNPKLRHLAAMRIPPPALAPVADAYARYIAPLRGRSKKCVVLDLDNTLWSGVVGEDGKDGIHLGNTSPGSEFVEFQAFLKSLAARGILLAVNSKNNAEDALDVIRTHEAMVLREADFSAVRINWLPKSENMLAIARELNIGVDALVFVDDNPDERERMRQLLPQVLTVEMPRDPALYRTTIERLPELQTLAVTAEDRDRAERYREISLREESKTNVIDVESYLASLEIVVDIEPATQANFPRIAQLFAKTNQFNVTTRRYSAADVARLDSDPGCRIWTLRSRDRFGEHGLVAIALVRIANGTWTLDSFLMSCRVIGYGIESALLAYVCERALDAGVHELVGEFAPTAKNAPAAELYTSHGFVAAGDDGATQRFRLKLADARAMPAWIRVSAHVA